MSNIFEHFRTDARNKSWGCSHTMPCKEEEEERRSTLVIGKRNLNAYTLLSLHRILYLQIIRRQASNSTTTKSISAIVSFPLLFHTKNSTFYTISPQLQEQKYLWEESPITTRFSIPLKASTLVRRTISRRQKLTQIGLLDLLGFLFFSNLKEFTSIGGGMIIFSFLTNPL